MAVFVVWGLWEAHAWFRGPAGPPVLLGAPLGSEEALRSPGPSLGVAVMWDRGQQPFPGLDGAVSNSPLRCLFWHLSHCFVTALYGSPGCPGRELEVG